MSASKTSSEVTTRRAGSSSAAQQDKSVVLPRAGGTGEHDGEAWLDRCSQEPGQRLRERSHLAQLVQCAEGDAGELPDVEHQVASLGEVTVDDVEPCPTDELGVLQAVLVIEGAMGRAGIVEDLREDPPDVVVIVEDLAVIAAHAPCRFTNMASGAFVRPRRAAPAPRYGTLAPGDLRLPRVFWETRASAAEGPYPSIWYTDVEPSAGWIEFRGAM